jgi:asparagine synthase (glutamine-hydrolysing)
MEELLNSRSIEQDGIFQYKTVERLKKEHSAGIANHSHILWSLIVFYDWKKRWLESPSPHTTLSGQ